MARIIVEENYGSVVEGEVIERVVVVASLGEAGPQGPPGPGSPAGGLTGQHLAKASDVDYDTTWETPPDPNIALDDLTDVSVPAPANGDQLTWDEDIGTWISRKSGAALGFTELDYKLTSPPNATPGAGYLSADSSIGNPGTATTLYFNKIDDAGNDLSLWFPYMKTGDWLNLHLADDTTQQARYDITGTPTLNGDIWYVPVTPFDDSGDTGANNAKLRVFWRVLGEDATRMRWRNIWQSGILYEAQDTVRDGIWTMIANKETYDVPSPQPIGDPYYYYTGDSGNLSTSAKQITYGMQYLFNSGGYMTGYRVNTIAGNSYRVFSVLNPQTDNITTEIVTFIADATGWQELATVPQLIPTGSEFQLIVQTYAPADTPITWNGDWNYTTPNNADLPGVGVIQHGNNQADQLRINKTDDNGGDRETELLALTAGDHITAGGMIWTVQSVLDSGGNYVTVGITPQTQITDGVYDFAFETVTATDIDYYNDENYYLADPNIQGLLAIDGSIGDVVPDDDQYGIDILLQQATISEDWDLVAVSAGSSGGGGGGSDSLPSLYNPHHMIAQNTTSHAIAGKTKLTWDTIQADPEGNFDGSDYTVPVDGIYQVNFAFGLGTTTNGSTRYIGFVETDGGYNVRAFDNYLVGNNGEITSGAVMVSVLKGEKISTYIQNIGGSPNFVGSLRNQLSIYQVTKTGTFEEENPGWQVIGKAKLAVAGDDLIVDSLPHFDRLRLSIGLFYNGSINGFMRYNDDSGGNYTYRRISNIVDTGGANQQTEWVFQTAGVTADINIQHEILNTIGQRHVVIEEQTQQLTASTSPTLRKQGGMWSVQDGINKIHIYNTQSGSYDVGSYIIVEGINT